MALSWLPFRTFIVKKIKRQPPWNVRHIENAIQPGAAVFFDVIENFVL